MKYNIHVVPSYANPKGHYGDIINSYSDVGAAILCATRLSIEQRKDFVVSNGLTTLFDTRED